MSNCDRHGFDLPGCPHCDDEAVRDEQRSPSSQPDRFDQMAKALFPAHPACSRRFLQRLGADGAEGLGDAIIA